MKNQAETNQAMFQAFADECYATKRNEKLKIAVREALVPEIATLEVEKTKIENSISALKDSFELGWTDCLYAETQLDTGLLFDVMGELDERAPQPVTTAENSDMEL